MNTMEKSKKVERAVQTGEGCCGGPAPEGISACCVKDAEAKASGEEGCGCGDSQVQASAQPSACCGAGSAIAITADLNAVLFFVVCPVFRLDSVLLGE